MGTKYNTGRQAWEFGAPCHYENGRVRSTYCGPCPACGSSTSTYGGAYSCHDHRCKNSSLNFTCSPETWPDWWNTDVIVFLDGTAWCATGAGFENLQESPAGFGRSPREAVKDLRHNAGLRGCPAKEPQKSDGPSGQSS